MGNVPILLLRKAARLPNLTSLRSRRRSRPRRAPNLGSPMTHPTSSHETPASLLAPLARGLLRRAPEILSLSIHDERGACALVERRLPARGRSRADRGGGRRSARRARAIRGLWWESADTARARCALAIFEGARFPRRDAGGVLRASPRARKTAPNACVELAPVLPVLAKALQLLPSEAAAVSPRGATPPIRTVVAALRFVGRRPDDETGRDIDALAREEHLLALIDTALREDEFALHLQPIVSLRDEIPQAADRRGADPPAHAGVRRAGLARIPRHGRAQRPHAGHRPLGDPRAARMDAAQPRSLGGCQRRVLGESVGQVGGASGFPRLSRALPRQVGPAA